VSGFGGRRPTVMAGCLSTPIMYWGDETSWSSVASARLLQDCVSWPGASTKPGRRVPGKQGLQGQRPVYTFGLCQGTHPW
jgi:hypothetical protein